MFKKLTIGCANLGYPYGLDNHRIKKEDTKKIFSTCRKKNIMHFDVADGYLNSYEILAKSKNNFKIDTKIEICQKWETLDFCEKHLKKINNRTGNLKIDTLYIHNEKFLKRKNSNKIIKNLHELKNKKYFKKLGVSIYDFNRIYLDIKKFKFDAVQCPFNIFDQRLVQDGHIKKLKKNKIKIHIRSIFLQGLLLNKRFIKLKKFKHQISHLTNYFNFLEKRKICPLNFCLNFVLNYRDIDKIIIGINSKKHLDDILNFKKKKYDNFKSFNLSHDKKIIDPRKW